MGRVTFPNDHGLWSAAIKEAEIQRVTMLESPSKEAVEGLAQRLWKRSRGARIRNDFVCVPDSRDSDDDIPAPPLARLAGICGRGGGEVALKLYLTLLWVSVGGDHSTNFEAAHWAQILALPPATGARRVRRAIRTLEDLGLIKVKINKGKAATITLLHDSGSKKPYALPDGRKEADRYFSLASQLWTMGIIQNLSTAGLTMLLILTEEVRGSDRPQWWSPRVFANKFGISSDTRTKGVKELKDMKLIVERNLPGPQDPSPKSQFTPTRRRKAYLLVNEARRPRTQDPTFEIN